MCLEDIYTVSAYLSDIGRLSFSLERRHTRLACQGVRNVRKVRNASSYI